MIFGNITIFIYMCVCLYVCCVIGAGPGYGIGEQQGRRPTMEDAETAIPGTHQRHGGMGRREQHRHKEFSCCCCGHASDVCVCMLTLWIVVRPLRRFERWIWRLLCDSERVLWRVRRTWWAARRWICQKHAAPQNHCHRQVQERWHRRRHQRRLSQHSRLCVVRCCRLSYWFRFVNVDCWRQQRV